METYLGQIAERAQVFTSDNSVDSIIPQKEQKPFTLDDPFENTIHEEREDIPTFQAVEAPKKFKKDTDTSDLRNPLQTDPEPNYMTRYIDRILDTKTGKDIIHLENKTNIYNRKSTEEHSQPSLPSDPLQDFNYNKDNTPINQTVGLEKLPTVVNESRTVELLQDVKKLNFNSISTKNNLTDILPVEKIEKQIIGPKSKPETPKLVIGRITVEIVPPLKIQKNHKQHDRKPVTSSQNTSANVNSKFIFGLGQL